MEKEDDIKIKLQIKEPPLKQELSELVCNSAIGFLNDSET
jgi:hypothetical protein